jgi:hypothetical protein
MLVTLDGAAVSDGLADKRVVSGVGGQHDFVSMAHRLPGARSVICVPSTRIAGGKTTSNIVFGYEHVTVPRHLRDVVVTEYGAAELRGASDRDVMVRLLGITDARFQEQLLAAAKAAGKVEANYRLPDAYRRNTPDQLAERFSSGGGAKLPHFPLGSDFDATEARLAVALVFLKAHAGSRWALVRLLVTAPKATTGHEAALERMRLSRPANLAERFHRRLLLAALAESDDARPL